MIKNNNLVKISLTCSKSAILNIEQNFVKLYFTDFENTISEKTYLNQEEILKKHQFFYFTPPPALIRCCSQQSVFHGKYVENAENT